MANQISLKIAMIKRWFKIFAGSSATAVEQGKGRFYSKDCIKGYYNDMTGKLGEGTLLDENGVPVSKISDGSEVNFPIAVFQYALGIYDKYIETKEKEYQEKFLKIAQWALDNQRSDGSWDCFGPLKSEKYSVSSMGQGEGISVLIRAYTLINDKKYLEAAVKAVDFMLTPMDKGGTAFYFGEELILEEYPQLPRRAVLNGWIFSLFGIYDISKLMPEKYSHIFIRCAKTVANHLSDYDNGYWSLYDLEKRVASPAYHKLHIALLDVMYDISEIEAFKEYKEKFERYQSKRLNKLRAVSKKFTQKITEHSDSVIVK